MKQETTVPEVLYKRLYRLIKKNNVTQTTLTGAYIQQLVGIYNTGTIQYIPFQCNSFKFRTLKKPGT